MPGTRVARPNYLGRVLVCRSGGTIVSFDPPWARFSDFRSVVDHPQQRPDPVVLRQLDRTVADFHVAAGDLNLAAGFADAMVAHLETALRLLDAVPRDDPFWAGTNRRPTQYTLGSFCSWLAERRPGDPEVAWLGVARGTVVGCCFHAPNWARLAGVADPHWMVDAALYADAYGSNESEDKLAELLTNAGLVAQVVDSLRERTTPAGRARLRLGEVPQAEFAAGWASRVLAACGQAG